MAGLAAGRELERAGQSVTIFEKSRGVGGRVSTRRVAECAIDHGAQLMKAPSPELLALVRASGAPELIQGPIGVFDGDGRVMPGDPALNSEPRWCWPGGNNALARFMARGLDLRLELTVMAIESAEVGYTLRTSTGLSAGPFAAVLLAIPAPQAATILEASVIEPTARADLLSALTPAHYRPCLSVALAYAHRPNPPWYALLNHDRCHPIAWLACEHSKPGRAPAEHGLILAQMSPKWSREHWQALPKGTYGQSEPLPAAIIEVHTLVCNLIEMEPVPPLWADVHRWRYALSEIPCGSAALAGRAGIYLAGDQEFGQGRVHLAIESGWRAAARMIASL